MRVGNISISTEALMWWIEGCGLVARNRMKPFAANAINMTSSFEEFRIRAEQEMKALLRDGPSPSAEGAYRRGLTKGEPVPANEMVRISAVETKEISEICSESFAKSMAVAMYFNGNQPIAWGEFVKTTAAAIEGLPKKSHKRWVSERREREKLRKQGNDAYHMLEMRR